MFPLGQTPLGVAVMYLVALIYVVLIFLIGRARKKMDPADTNVWNTRTVARIAILSAVAAAGALITVPGPVASIKLDSAAGFFAAAAFGWQEAVIVAMIGNFFSEFLGGFHGWLPAVPYYMVTMALAVNVYGYLSKRIHIIVGIIGGVAVNMLCLLPWAIMLGWPIVTAIAPVLLSGATANVILATVAHLAISRARTRRKPTGA